MATATLTSGNIVHVYWGMIKHLSLDAKVDLITMLSQSLKTPETHQVSAKKYYGIWGDDGISDDEFVAELKSLRTQNHDILEI